MEDENHREEELEEEVEGAEEIAAAQEGEEGEVSEKRRGYKPRKKTLVFEKGLDSIFRKRDHATDGFTREMERWQLRMKELNQQEREFLVEQHEDELRRIEEKHKEEIRKISDRLNERIKAQEEELAAARGMVRELQKELELEKDKRKRGIPFVEGEDEEWNPDEERARERVGDGRDESWLRK